MSALASPRPTPRAHVARRARRSRRSHADALRWLPLAVPLAALGLCALTALIWSAVLFVI